jgi:hypothetical protein
MSVGLLNTHHHVKPVVLIALSGGGRQADSSVHVIGEGTDEGVIPFNIPSFTIRYDVVFH